MDEKLNNVMQRVLTFHKDDKTSHDVGHIMRVYNLSMDFAKSECADEDVIALTALLHDVDDYKIVGKEESEKLSNAKAIMQEASINSKIQDKVIDNIKSMGYSKYLLGIRPNTLEGMVVSDGDMCDAIGVSGIVRMITFSLSDEGNGIIFDRNVFPNLELTADEYKTHSAASAVNYIFEKEFKLLGIMMTNSGKSFAEKKKKIMIDFLTEFFKEERADEWLTFLENYFKCGYDII